MEIQATLNPCKRRSRFSEPANEAGSRISRSRGGGEDHGSLLPEWFLIEVLCRLPTRALFRFKSVSRQCLSLISDPSFLRLYQSRASAFGMPRCKLAFIARTLLPQFPKMASQQPELAYEHDLISPELYFLTIPTFQRETPEKLYSIRAVDKRFLLYARCQYCCGHSRDYGYKYFVCNPLTKQWFALPPHDCFVVVNEGFIARVEEGNLASFKVILVNNPPTKRKFLEFQVFSSETGRWEDFVVHYEFYVQLSYFRKPVVLSNILHWIDCELGIVAYDPYNSPDKLRIIEFPDDAGKWPDTVPGNRSFTTKCGIFQGRLRYFEIVRLSNPQESWTLKIWELQDYSHDQSWSLQHSTWGEDITAPVQFRSRVSALTLTSFHPWDPDIVYMHWIGRVDLVSYNLRTKRVEELHTTLQSKYDIEWDRMFFSECFLLGPIDIPTSPRIGPDDRFSSVFANSLHIR